MIYIYQQHKQNGFTTKFPILIRFTGSDSNLLSTQSRSAGITAWIDYYSHKKDKHGKWLTHMMTEIENMLINKYNGQPHYGKYNRLNKKR